LSTFPDGVFQYNGIPVGGGRYEGMWGRNKFFVDYDNGVDGSSGTSVKSPGKYLQDAIDASGKWDVVYVRPRDPDIANGSPNTHLPEATTNWSISYLKHGLSLIGTGVGYGLASTYGTVLRGTATAGATPALYVKAPLTNIENISFHRGGSTYNPIGVGAVGACVAVIGGSATTNCAYQNTFTNCSFWDNDCGSGGKSVGLHTDDAWFLTINGCQFIDCGWGVTIGASATISQGIRILGTDFMAIPASVQCDIYSNGAVANILISGCNFNHTIPAGGSPNKYIVFSSASTGMVSNCWTGAAATTVGTNTTLNGVNYSQLYGGNNIDRMTTS
jgi:hypothetical protein